MEWNKNSTDKAINSILVDTKRDALFELAVNSNNESLLSPYVNMYCKQVYNFRKECTVNGYICGHYVKVMYSKSRFVSFL